MRKLVITTSENNHLAVDLIRYFSFKNNQYLIYTMNEFDEKDYIQLYVVKIMEELGELIAQTINDEDWSEMQNIVKKVLKEIKSGKKKLLHDLDYNSLSKIKIVEPRHFKLDRKLVELLGSQYMFKSNETMFNDQLGVVSLEPMGDNVETNSLELESIDETIAKECDFSSKLFESNAGLNNVETTTSTISDIQEDKVVDLNDEENKINYKELYFATKDQNEASAELISQMMLQLAAYKEKFGELDI